MRRHEGLATRVREALFALHGLGELASRAHDMGWWPYGGRADAAVASGGPPTGSPSLHAGDAATVTAYTSGAAHLQRAVQAADACAQGQRYRWQHRRLTPEVLPGIDATPSPARCQLYAGWLSRWLPELSPAINDPDATREVLDALADTCREILAARREFERAAPPLPTGRGAARRPTKPARRRG